MPLFFLTVASHQLRLHDNRRMLRMRAIVEPDILRIDAARRLRRRNGLGDLFELRQQGRRDEARPG